MGWQSTFVGTHNVTHLDTLSYIDEYIFSVESNSTVSSLSFNPDSLKLGFTVSGPWCTQGYVRVTVAKSLVHDIEDVKVYLNGEKIDYAVTSLDDSWLLYFTYLHSTHEVTISLGGISTLFNDLIIKAVVYGVPIAAIIILTVFYVAKRKKVHAYLIQISSS